MLSQKKEGEKQVLMYYSTRLDNMGKGQAGCTRCLGTLAKAIDKTNHILMCHPLKINTNHGVVAFLSSSAFTLSPARKTVMIQLCGRQDVDPHAGLKLKGLRRLLFCSGINYTKK